MKTLSVQHETAVQSCEKFKKELEVKRKENQWLNNQVEKQKGTQLHMLYSHGPLQRHNSSLQLILLARGSTHIVNNTPTVVIFDNIQVFGVVLLFCRVLNINQPLVTYFLLGIIRILQPQSNVWMTISVA